MLKEIEKKISNLNQKVHFLETAFNQFFSGEALVPPSKERERLEKEIRALQNKMIRSPRIRLAIENLFAKFSLYNNKWLKRLNDVESGKLFIEKQKILKSPTKKKITRPDGVVSVKDDSSLNGMLNNYAELFGKKAEDPKFRAKIAGTIKAQMDKAKIDTAKVSLKVIDGKLKVQIRPYED